MQIPCFEKAWGFIAVKCLELMSVFICHRFILYSRSLFSLEDGKVIRDMPCTCLSSRKLKIKKVTILALCSLSFVGICCASIETKNLQVRGTNNNKDTRQLQDETPAVKIWTRSGTDKQIIYHRIGRSLSLNCSINNHSASEIGWKRAGQWQDSRTHIVSPKLQILEFDTGKLTLRDNKTILWCGPRQSNVSYQGSSVTVIVGDLPEGPIEAESQIVGFLTRQIQIHWKPSPNTGSLYTTYKVTFTNCYNMTYCNGTRAEFSQPHIPGKTKYVFKDESQMFGIFNVTLIAENVLGLGQCSQSLLIDEDTSSLRPFLWPTPYPPKGLVAKPQGSREIFVKWIRSSELGLEMNFTVVYTQEIFSDKEDIIKILQDPSSSERRKIKTESASTTSVVLRGLEPYTAYYIYLTSNFIKHSQDERGGGYSELKGPKVIHTLQGNPDDGPNIVSDSSLVLLDETGKRNVTVWWKVPPLRAWKGVPDRLLVQYKINSAANSSRSDVSYNVSVPAVGNTLPDSTVLPFLSTDEEYSVYTKFCNKMVCGGIGGQQYLIHRLDSSTPTGEPPSNTDFSMTNIVITGVTVAMTAMLLISVAVYCKRRISRRKKPQPLDQRFPNARPDTEKYEEPDEISTSDTYDDAFTLTIVNEANETRL